MNKKVPTVLVVDDDSQIRRILNVTLKSWNYDPLEAVELDLVQRALAKTGDSITHAARLLNISRDQVRYRLKSAKAAQET